MEIERELLKRMSIEEFADSEGLVMRIVERPIDLSYLKRFYARFKNVFEVGAIGIHSDFGDGNSEEEAIRDYASRISGKRLIINPFNQEIKREILAPVFTE